MPSNRKRTEVTITGEWINRISGAISIALSVVALLAVLNGYTRPPQPDEEAAAHIFQLSILTLFPMILVFLSYSGLEAGRAERATAGVSSRHFGYGVCRAVLP
jgi:hypothetical protein